MLFPAIAVLFSILHCFILLPSLSSGLYLDQIGKFDWHTKHLGCPHQTWLGRIRDFDALIVLSRKNVAGRLDLDTGNIVWRQVSEPNGPQLELISVDSSSIQIKQAAEKDEFIDRTFDIHTGILQTQSLIKNASVDEKRLAAAEEKGLTSPSEIDRQSGRVEFRTEEGGKVRLNFEGTAPIRELKIFTPGGGKPNERTYKIFLTRADCSMEMHELAMPAADAVTDSVPKPRLLWRRFESLAEISDAQMIEMPLSEAQTQIETEFNLDEPAWRSFLLRVRSQFEQLNRLIFSTVERIVQTLEMVIRGELHYSSAVVRQLFDLGPRAAGGAKLERDYFNLRKVIVVSTLAGTLHGLSNDDGQVLWSLYLGDHFSPYRNEQKGDIEGKVSLFIQRGTSFYQWASRAAVVFNEKDSAASVILQFNPITGEQIDQLRIQAGLTRVELWPFPDAEQLHSLFLLRKSNPTPEWWPPLPPAYVPPKPVFVMMVERENGSLRGYKVDRFANPAHLTEQWLTVLPGFESIYTIVGKPPNQKMHSPGKVLGDRAVLYKYNNPNLVAVLSNNPAQSTLRLHLVDSVSGQLIYSGRYVKAAPPFHVVHCENWLVISYWNEKARRTEVGVVELFEGMQQTNASTFDSLTGTMQPLQVVAQTFIFPQGISAMAATSTEQGLTSRAVLFALPFGGILEMSRRFLDARRPLEMTPEMREEMLIPYMPELPLSTEDLINYYQTTLNVRGIRTAPSGLESTSLVFVFGLDLFYTRVTPSGTFDILKDDFDYVLIAAVMFALVAASIACKRIWRYQSIQQAWA